MNLDAGALAKFQAYVELLRDCADRHGGPADLAEAFHGADRYPEFDGHPDANYVTGLVQGFADALGVPPTDLLAFAKAARRASRKRQPTNERRDT